MIVGIKDVFKLVGVIIVVFCAIFVCTFFLNFYIDAKSLELVLNDEELLALHRAQMATAKFTCAISGGVLMLIALVMLVFYIKLYIDSHAKQLGILKAMGYTEREIALRFSVFGISVFFGCAAGFGCGFAIMPLIYSQMSNGLPEITIGFHPSVLVLFVILPTLIFSAFACVYAFFALRSPANELLRGKPEKLSKKPLKVSEKERGFLKEMCIKTLSSKKSLAFFVAFACFCFAAMIQMAVSMYKLSTKTMGIIIFAIGAVLAVTSILMAITSLVNGNSKNIAIMKAYGYSTKECALAVLRGYHFFALLGFAVGTVYQYVLLSVMINIVFKDVGAVPEYSFNVSVFFITLAVFIVFYEAVMLLYSFRINKISLKQVMEEN